MFVTVKAIVLKVFSITGTSQGDQEPLRNTGTKTVFQPEESRTKRSLYITVFKEVSTLLESGDSGRINLYSLVSFLVKT